MENDLFLESFSRLLADVVGTTAVRAIHDGADTTALWQAITESGFLDALVSEGEGGAGLSRADILPLFTVAGQYLVPVAFSHTVIARMLIADVGQALPVDGPIILWPLGPSGTLRSHVAPAAFEARHALVQQGSSFGLLPLLVSETEDGFGFPTVIPDVDATPLIAFALDDCDLLHWAAALTAISSAGAIARVLDLSRQHVMDRQQFGRPLGNFQAIQHMIAQAAEQTVLAATAARIGFSGTGVALNPLRVALAKTVTANAASELARIAHAVHGAIGVSQEHDLQLYTRLLKRWQLSYGSEDFWADQIGTARIAAADGTAADFIRASLVP